MEQQLKDAIARIDSVLAQVSLPRPQHAQLAQDLQIVQERVKLSFEQATDLKRIAAGESYYTVPGEQNARTNQRPNDD